MFRVILITLLTFVGVAVPSGTANALTAMTCVSSTDVSYQPGLRLQPQEVKIDVDGGFLLCTGVGANGITTGSYDAKLKAVRSCADLLTPTTGVFTIDWNAGAAGFSTISFSRTATIVGGNIVTTETGTVVAGDFAGHSTVFVTVGPNNLLECTTPAGVQNVHTNGDLTIAGL